MIQDIMIYTCFFLLGAGIVLGVWAWVNKKDQLL